MRMAELELNDWSWKFWFNCWLLEIDWIQTEIKEIWFSLIQANPTSNKQPESSTSYIRQATK